MTTNAFALSFPAARCLVTSTLDSLSVSPLRTEADREVRHQAALEALAVLQPRNAAEAMLAAQAVSAHHASMDCFHRAAAPGVPDNLAMRILGRALALSRMALQMNRALTSSKAAPAEVPQPVFETDPASAASAPFAEPPAQSEQPDIAPPDRAAPATAEPALAPSTRAAQPGTTAVPVRGQAASVAGQPAPQTAVVSHPRQIAGQIVPYVAARDALLASTILSDTGRTAA
jgi:hypothetical protein